MKTIQITGIEYTATIEDSDIVLESLTNRIVIPEGGDLLEAEADDAWYKTKRGLDCDDHRAFMNYSKTAWINEYIDEKLIEFVQENLALGKVETYHLN